MGGKWKWLFGLALFTVLAYLAVDFVRYVNICRYYFELANRGTDAIAWKPGDREAIVVLAGDVGRIPKAIGLLRIRKSPLLIISGAGQRVTKTALLNQQGDAVTHARETWEKIFIESKSTSTRENAEESGKILSARGIQQVILVTSEYHMPRALATFRLILPSLQYSPYPVQSRASLPLWFTTGGFSLMYKITLEYWKRFMFDHFFQRYWQTTLHPGLALTYGRHQG